ncbi:MAG: c-type cytochrome [Flavobacteriales bacterium]|jgi:mono/diheme cytochrome c family protein|tara:strand:+ start:1429 stop:1833 length:405 start_codon:yes stop_codon:yes gene_type:complete
MKYLLSVYCIGVFSFLSYMQQEKPLKQSILDGEEIYQDFCLQCHLDNGKGVENAFPPLVKSDYLQNNIEASIRGVKYGLRGEITVNGKTYNGVMVNQGLDEEEIADVMNYILNSWGNKAEGQITVAQVLEVQKQ